MTPSSRKNVKPCLIEAKITFDPPDFGVTFLGASSGFDPADSTSGFILWINQRGILVDPPVFSIDALHKIGIPPTMIDKIILTHCHSDHDAGIFQKVIQTSAVEVISTRTIMDSFLRKYSAIIGISFEETKRLFEFRPVIIDYPLILNGAVFQFFYSFHSIPCLGFTIKYQNEQLYYSGDTFYDKAELNKLLDKQILTKARHSQLTALEDLEEFSLILHEAGGLPIHTSLKALESLPSQIKENLQLYSLPANEVSGESSSLERVKCGLSNTIILQKDTPKDPLIHYLEIFSNIDFFEKIPLKRIVDLIKCVHEVKFKQGDFVVREGTKGNKFYVVKKGVAKIYSRTAGREFSKFIYPGDHFGESAIIGNGIRMANVVCETACLLLEINKNDFLWCIGLGTLESGPIKLMKNLTDLRHTNYAEFINNKLTELQKTDLNMRIEVAKVTAGETLWSKGSPCEFCMFICGGEFELDSPEEHNGKIKLHQGQLVADFPAMLNEGRSTSSVRCLKTGDILRVKRELLMEFLTNNPGLFIFIRDKLVVD